MTTLINNIRRDIQNSIEFNIDGKIAKSIYYQIDNKLIRIADHLPKEANIDAYNEGVELVMLIMIGDNTSEHSVLKYCDNSGYEADYIIINEEMPFEGYNEMLLNEFLNN